MIEDRRYRFDGPKSGSVGGRFESDAETLPFPVGGVFGPIRLDAPAPSDKDWDEMDTVTAIERVIDRMQGQLNELESDVEDVIAHIGAMDAQPNDDGWRPSAA